MLCISMEMRGGTSKPESETLFKESVKLHKSRNAHHKEYWENEEMPTVFIVEMVCDWWSFSLAKNKPLEIFDWFETNQQKLSLSENEKEVVECVFEEIKVLAKEKNAKK